MIDKRLVVRFFRIVAERGAVTPTAILNHISQLNEADRFQQVGSFDLRIDHLQTHGGLILADFVRLQTENIPGAAGPSTPQRPLGLPTGEGLAHCAALAFDPGTSVVALQANRNGLSPGGLAAYLGCFVAKPSKYEVLPILRSDALRRLRRLNPTSIEVKIATPTDLSVMDDEQATVKATLASMKDIAGGGFIEISIGRGRRHSDLRRGRVRSMLRWLSGEAAEGRGGIEKLRVVGTSADDDDAAQQALDLLKEIMQAETVLTLPDDIGENFSRRVAFVLHALQERHGELAEMFSGD